MTEAAKQFLHGFNAVALVDPGYRPGALLIATEEARQVIGRAG